MPIYRDLKVRLTPSEWESCASALAQVQQDRSVLEEEKKQAMTGFKARDKVLEEKLRSLGERVRSHQETRAVECWERFDVNRLVVDIYRSDLGEYVESRPMTASERHDALQPGLPGLSRVGDVLRDRVDARLRKDLPDGVQTEVDVRGSYTLDPTKGEPLSAPKGSGRWETIDTPNGSVTRRVEEPKDAPAPPAPAPEPAAPTPPADDFEAAPSSGGSEVTVGLDGELAPSKVMPPGKKPKKSNGTT